MHTSTTLSEDVVADGTKFEWAAEVESGGGEGEFALGPPAGPEVLLVVEVGAPDPVIGDGDGAGDTAITTAGTNRRMSIMTANPRVATMFFMLTLKAIFSPTTIKLL